MKVLFIGPVGEYKIHDGGYGNAASGMYFVLDKMQKEGLIDELELCTTSSNRISMVKSENYDLSITMAHPSSFVNANTKVIFKQIYKLCKKNYLSVVWETVPLPSSWDFLWKEDIFDGFLCPSNFIMNQIKELSKKPLFYYPHFLNKDTFPQLDIEEKKKETIFKVLFIGQYTTRKGVEDAVIAYSRALGEKKDCKLILKIHPLSNKEIHPDEYIKFLNRCNVKKHNTNSIYSLESFLDSKDLSELYKESSILLMCSRGEGFGIPAGEAMLSGIPVIYTNWSALPEVAQADGNYPVDYFLDEAVNMTHYNYENNSKYAKPSICDLMDQLSETYKLWTEDKEKYYNSVSGNRRLIEDKFGEEKIREYLTEIING